MRLIPIASGSSGNCIYVGSECTHLLIDVGISGKKTEAGVNSIGLSMSEIDGILITHEHSDHIAGLGVISRKHDIPIYTTRGTKEALLNKIGNIDPELICEIYPDDKLTIKDISVIPMKVSHDAADPVAFTFSSEGKKIGIATDLGIYTDYTVEHLKGMDALFLEANHDVKMLEVGPYPYYLKRRILGNKGHLSNELAGDLLSKLLHDGLKSVYLGHLSKENNLPELAYETVRCQVNMSVDLNKNLGKCNMSDITMDDIPLYIAKRDEISEIINI